MKTDDLLKQAQENPNESSISLSEKSFDDDRKAAPVFATLKAMLLEIGEWNEHSLISTYALFEENGKESSSENLSVGKLIRIALKASGKYDWIRVIDIFESEDEFIITVKPTFDPTAEKVDESVTSHFFTDESTNNFCLCRRSEKVTLYVIGLNEKQNTGETGGALETIRNVAVNIGTYLGIQKSEWEKFCQHFLEDAAARNGADTAAANE